jgi:SAM-dependent methyltransferase
VKSSVLELLVCRCCDKSFRISRDVAEGAEVMEGNLECEGCGVMFPIRRGIPRFVEALDADKKATADAFGYEWTHYSRLTEADKREFLAWISPLQPADFKGQVVLDAGCGKGRHIVLAAEFEARTVVGIDLSDAVEAAFRNTRKLPNVHVIQADILNLPFHSPFTLVYTIGVIHHLPDPKSGFLALAKHVKPGGRISTWVYGKEGNLWIEKLVDPARKNITSRLPRFLTCCLSFPPAVILYGGLNLFYRLARRWTWLKEILPYSEYLCSISDYTFAENFWNVFDQLVAPTAFYHSYDEVADWYRTASIHEARIERHNGNSWRGTGLVRVSARGTDLGCRFVVVLYKQVLDKHAS